jgi:hypothetical protein
MLSSKFGLGVVRFSALNILLCLLAVRASAQGEPSNGEPIKLDPGLLTDYWVHTSMVAFIFLFFAGLLILALRKFYSAMSEPKRGGLWLETHWGGLGGGLGGWRVSNALVYLVLLGLLGGLAVATISMMPTYPTAKPEAQKDSARAEAVKTSTPKNQASTDTSNGTTGVTADGSKGTKAADKTPATAADQNK